MIKQTDPANLPAMRRYGCRAFSLMTIPQVYCRKPLEQKHVDAIVTLAMCNEAVLSELAKAGIEEHQIVNWGFWCLGFPRLRGRQVGQVLPGKEPEYWGGRIVPAQYSICHWKTGGELGHWTLFTGDGESELYDPWDPQQAVGISGVPDRWVIDKRVVDLRLLYYVWEV